MTSSVFPACVRAVSAQKVRWSRSWSDGWELDDVNAQKQATLRQDVWVHAGMNDLSGLRNMAPTPLVTDLVTVEAVDADFVADVLASGRDRARRHDDWHPDFPRQDDRDGLGMVREVTAWSPRVIRRRADNLLVGTVGFFGPPEFADDGVPEVEIGYGLVEEARRRGLMRNTLAVLLALTDSVGVRVRGATTSDNAASLASMAGAGFVVVAANPDDAERQVLLVRPLAR